MRKNKFGPLNHIIYKNWLKIDQISKYKSYNDKTFEVNLCGFGLVTDFLDMTTKAQLNKKNIDI